MSYTQHITIRNIVKNARNYGPGFLMPISISYVGLIKLRPN